MKQKSAVKVRKPGGGGRESGGVIMRYLPAISRALEGRLRITMSSLVILRGGGKAPTGTDQRVMKTTRYHRYLSQLPYLVYAEPVRFVS